MKAVGKCSKRRREPALWWRISTHVYAINFFVRRSLGDDYLNLLQLFLNHRCFMRSLKPERVGKSPKQLLTGETHPHWLELLGFERFQRD